MKYKPVIVLAFFAECGLPKPELEYRFHERRKWRMDFAWPAHKVFVEVNGGIWLQGAKRGHHSRGAGILKDWEKWNEAAAQGWRALFCAPKDLCTADFVSMIGRTLEACRISLSTNQNESDQPPEPA